MRAYAAELHLVHYHSQYRDIGEAMKQPGGLAVLGFFIEASNIDNRAFEPLLDITDRVQYKGSKVEYYAPLPLLEMLPRDLTSFWRYNGSLTVPMCWESVVWTVFKEPIRMSHNQLDMFRELYQGFFMEPNGQLEMLHIEDNFRPTQPLFGRQIMENTHRPSAAGGGRNRYGFSHSGSAAVTPTTFLLLLSGVMSLVCRSL